MHEFQFSSNIPLATTAGGASNQSDRIADDTAAREAETSGIHLAFPSSGEQENVNAISTKVGNANKKFPATHVPQRLEGGSGSRSQSSKHAVAGGSAAGKPASSARRSTSYTLHEQQALDTIAALLARAIVLHRDQRTRRSKADRGKEAA